MMDEHQWLREQLRDESVLHRPDRDRMFARIEARTAPSRRPRGLRVAVTVLSTAAALVPAAALAVHFAGDDDTVRPQATRVTESPLPPLSERSAAVSEPSAAVSLTAGAAVDPHSHQYWAQNNLTLRVQEPLDGLTAVIRVKITPRVEATGSWLSLAKDDFLVETERAGDALEFRFTLLPGRRVRPGTYVLAAQYNRDATHDPVKDAYTVEADAAGGPVTTLKGHF